jgi:hypothetical protein
MGQNTIEVDDAVGMPNRLYFLYKVIEDTQATIRFLDTKAAFCVTLVSGMAAVGLQKPLHHEQTMREHVLVSIFLAVVILTLLVCLRVIFPTIKPSGSFGAPAEPKFYIGHNKAHHWIKHTMSNRIDNILSETHDSYFPAVNTAEDADLLASLVDTVLMTALIRQVKSDRLHTALFLLMGSVFLFAVVVLT